MDKSEIFEQVREVDDVVLKSIDRGDDDIQKVTSETSLKRSKVDWSFRKLQDLGLVEVESPDGMVERTVNGTRQVFQHPKTAELTDLGDEYIASRSIDLEGYEDWSRSELVRRVQRLEGKVEELEDRFELFREQVQSMIQD